MCLRPVRIRISFAPCGEPMGLAEAPKPRTYRHARGAMRKSLCRNLPFCSSQAPMFCSVATAKSFQRTAVIQVGIQVWAARNLLLADHRRKREGRRGSRSNAGDSDRQGSGCLAGPFAQGFEAARGLTQAGASEVAYACETGAVQIPWRRSILARSLVEPFAEAFQAVVDADGGFVAEVAPGGGEVEPV